MNKIYIYAGAFFSIAFAVIGALLVTLYNDNVLTLFDIIKIGFISILTAELIESFINK